MIYAICDTTENVLGACWFSSDMNIIFLISTTVDVPNGLILEQNGMLSVLSMHSTQKVDIDVFELDCAQFCDISKYIHHKEVSPRAPFPCAG